MEGVGQRSTHQRVFFTRQSSTGFILRATSFICSGGTSLSSVMLCPPRSAMYACIFFIRDSSCAAEKSI